MATLDLTAFPAKPSDYGGFSVILRLNAGNTTPVPRKRLEVKTLADVQRAIASYRAEAEATGAPLAVSADIAQGRAPSGYRAWRATQPGFYRVNV
jgi:hypothetical protein